MGHKVEDRMAMWAAKRTREEAAELMLEGAQEIADLRRKATLTDAELEAVENCIYASERIGDDWSDKQAATLRGLLERLQ